MEYDLLFTLITKPEWKIYSSSGSFEPNSLAEKGYIQCYSGSQVEYAANNFFSEDDELFLIVIDPLRVQVPIKNEKTDDEIYPNLYGAFSIDAIIDRILVKRGKKGSFSIRVKHFD
ncbi:MAG: DUF952 domain-containing protein [Balneolaceae bacterium]|nr:DUF952 domain-containing protein [Balneolaceae bacterium]MBO6546207.1 DUF952 domain-containing protein [Balneolaceae bacterium]MBO6648566.1 DUF952 domain-containing protein [Balneolaceae bacterium]